MSEPDAVPLPRDGEVFFDVRGESRTMRLSWYADSRVAVFSIWQGSRCTGTFRLPFTDLARMVHALQSGPPMPPGNPPETSPYSGRGYSEPGPAYHYGQEPGYRPEPGYVPEPPYGQDPGYNGAGYVPEHPYAPGVAPEGAPDSFSGFNSGDVGYELNARYDQPPYASSAPEHGYQPADYASAPVFGLTDYDPPNYGDQESVPDTAMLSFPSVPARNGPGSYR